jgi:cytidylate kinase
MLNDARIAISGKSGCGNTTVSRMVAGKLGLRLINYTFHDMASEMGISFKEMVVLANRDLPQYDIQLDKKLVTMALAPGCVLASRLAVWLLKKADLKVYLFASPEVRAGRIADRENQDFEQALSEMVERDRLDRERYLQIYGIDIDKYDFVDQIIDVNSIDQYSITEKIVDKLLAK